MSNVLWNVDSLLINNDVIFWRCLTGEARERPDSVELGALLASQLMAMADRLAAVADQLQLRLERERQRTLRYIYWYTGLSGIKVWG